MRCDNITSLIDPSGGNLPHPMQVGDAICSIVDHFYPRPLFSGIKIAKHPDFEIIPRRGVLLRIAAALVATSFASELINHGDQWLRSHLDSRYIPQIWSPKGGLEQPRQVCSLLQRLRRLCLHEH